MFKPTTAFSSFSVDDIEKAKHFYGQVLGFEITDSMGGAIDLHTLNGGKIFVYPKKDHASATFTILNLIVPHIDEAVDELTALGIVFEKYDEEFMKTDDKGIARGDGEQGPSIAWCKDPAGNFISIIEDKK